MSSGRARPAPHGDSDASIMGEVDWALEHDSMKSANEPYWTSTG